jgi:octaprenyl-diphosphate synthase
MLTTEQNKPALLTLSAFFEKDLLSMQARIEKSLSQALPMIHEVSKHLLKGKAKHIRPICVLLSANMHAYQAGDEHIALAGIVELLHAATLLHDDVIDQAQTRRGKPAAQQVWGNKASILVGDYLYALAFEWIADLKQGDVIQTLSRSTSMIVQGEVRQLVQTKNLVFSLQAYEQTIQAKTAELFAVSFKLGAMIATDDALAHQHAYHFGLNYGILYQMFDDYLDYFADAKVIGKPVFQDIQEGKVTKPLIILHAYANDAEKQLLLDWLSQKAPFNHQVLQALIDKYALKIELQSRLRQRILDLRHQSCILPGQGKQATLHQLIDFFESYFDWPAC